MISLMYIPGCDKALLRVSEYAICSFSFRWLSPCRIFMESLAKTYEQYKDKGLEVYTVSLDNNAEAWKKLVTEKNFGWTDVIGGMSRNQKHMSCPESRHLF